MAIDVHAHVIVPELLRGSRSDAGWRPRVWREDGAQLVELEGRAIRSAVEEFVDVETILGTAAARGIDHVLLCPWVALLFLDDPAEVGRERCALQNAGLAALRAAHPDAVSVLGAVPLQDPELAAAELEALMASGEFAGVEITASVAGHSLGEPHLAPFWAAAEATEALVFVHPTTRGFGADVFARHYLWNLVGNPMETTIAAADLILSGTLERHPRLRVLLAHGGGAITALAGRIAHGQRTVGAAGAASAEPATEAVRRFLYDTITHDPARLRELVATVGADRVLLGTDHPFDMADSDPLDTVRAAGLTAADEAAVTDANARRELRLTTPPGRN